MSDRLLGETYSCYRAKIYPYINTVPPNEIITIDRLQEKTGLSRDAILLAMTCLEREGMLSMKIVIRCPNCNMMIRPVENIDIASQENCYACDTNFVLSRDDEYVIWQTT